MTRKDYRIIAQVLGESFVSIDNPRILQELNATVSNMCWYLQKDNPRFDREKFKSYVKSVTSKGG